MPRLRQEVREDATVQIGLTELAALEEGFASLVEGAVEEGEEGEGLGCEDLAMGLVDVAEDGHALENGVCGRHGCGGEEERRWLKLRSLYTLQASLFGGPGKQCQYSGILN